MTTDARTEHDASTADAPASGIPVVDRRAAFAAGPAPFPRKVIYWILAAVVVLGGGGAIADRFLTGAVAKTGPATAVGRPTDVKPGTAAGQAPPAGAQLHAALPAFLGLSSLEGRRAPGFSLTDAATGAQVSLSGLRGHVVVLTFANAACNDICPVLASELSQAASMVGTTPVPVTFLTVNSDPLDLGGGARAAILSDTGFTSLSNWRFLTGGLSTLNAVWVSYGISITAEQSTGVAAHNDLMYFIRPNGTLAWSAVPFADESPSGTFSLPAAETARFADGIAHYADLLARGS